MLNVFPSAAYLANQCGDVLALVSSEVGPGPLAIVLTGVRGSFFDWLRPGEAVRFTSGQIRSNQLSVRLNGQRWEARPAWETLRASRERLRTSLPELERILITCAPAGSLATLLKPPASSGPKTHAVRFVDEARARSGTFLAALAAALRYDWQPDASTLVDLRIAVADLAGLGGGFTPASDDFLVGAVYALSSTKPAAMVQGFSNEIAAAASPRTTTVSGAYLQAAAKGAASPLWHRLLEAIVLEEADSKRAAVRLLAGVGHTSGADALTGYLLAARSILADLR